MTTNSKFQFTLFVLRLFLGIVVLGHGVQKLFGWFGGYGFEGTMSFFTETIGLPYIAGVLVIVAETLGMVALMLGVLGRFLAGCMVVIMLGAIITTHGPQGFFMDWNGTMAGEGYEFHLLIIALSLAILVNGTGAYSLQHFIFRRLKLRTNSDPYAVELDKK